MANGSGLSGCHASRVTTFWRSTNYCFDSELFCARFINEMP